MSLIRSFTFYRDRFTNHIVAASPVCRRRLISFSFKRQKSASYMKWLGYCIYIKQVFFCKSGLKYGIKSSTSQNLSVPTTNDVMAWYGLKFIKSYIPFTDDFFIFFYFLLSWNVKGSRQERGQTLNIALSVPWKHRVITSRHLLVMGDGGGNGK